MRFPSKSFTVGIKIPRIDRLIIIAVGIGVLFTAFLYFTLMDTPPIGYRMAAILMTITLAAWVGFYFFLRKIILPHYRKFPMPYRRAAILFSGIVGFFLVFSSQIYLPPNRFLMPKQHLRITMNEAINPASQGSEVQIHWIQTAISGTNFAWMTYSDDWQRVGGELKTLGAADTFLNWDGPTGGFVTIVFTKSPSGGMVNVEWNGEVTTVDLYADQPQQWAMTQTFHVPFYYNMLSILVIGLFFSLLVFLCLILLSSVIDKAHELRTAHRRWWVFALPMALTWSLYLLAFYPAIMGPDSISQWAQVNTLQFINHHPIFHTLFIWLLTRIWNSPTMVSLCQIAALALVTAWGIGSIEELTGKKGVSWLTAGLFALSPVNGIMVSTLNKDVAYAIALLSLMIILFKMVVSEGRWLNKPLRWLGLGLTLFAVSVFRQNGLPVAFVTLFTIVIFFRVNWRKVGMSLLVWAALFGIVQYPLQQMLHVQSSPVASSFIIHHIAAHLSASEEIHLKGEDTAYLASILPLQEWKNRYRCYWVDTLYYNRNIHLENVNFQRLLKIWFPLFLQNPLVDWEHTLCSGTAFWKLNPERIYLPEIEPTVNGSLTWIFDNPFGIEESSKIPLLANWIYRIALVKYPTPGLLYPHIILLWGSAIYTLLAIFSIMVAIFRLQNSRLSMLLVPILAQTGVVILVSISQDFRYQYAMYLTGLWSIGLFFVRPRR